MTRALLRCVALFLVMLATGCEFLPHGPLDELEPPAGLPEPSTSWIELGRRLLAADRPGQAHDAFVRSLRVEGVTAAALTGAGIAAERQGLLNEARRLFERAHRAQPGSVEVHNNLGAVYYRMGDFHAAHQAFQAALALSDGTSRVAARNLGVSAAALARAERTERLAANPVRLQRLGKARFRLFATAGLQENG